eukprot:734662_1
MRPSEIKKSGSISWIHDTRFSTNSYSNNRRTSTRKRSTKSKKASRSSSKSLAVGTKMRTSERKISYPILSNSNTHSRSTRASHIRPSTYMASYRNNDNKNDVSKASKPKSDTFNIGINDSDLLEYKESPSSSELQSNPKQTTSHSDKRNSQSTSKNNIRNPSNIFRPSPPKSDPNSNVLSKAISSKPVTESINIDFNEDDLADYNNNETKSKQIASGSIQSAHPNSNSSKENTNHSNVMQIVHSNTSSNTSQLKRSITPFEKLSYVQSNTIAATDNSTSTKMYK